MTTFNLASYCNMYERLNSSQTLRKLKFDITEELLEQYKSRFPSCAYLLEEVPPRRLTPSSCIAFQFRTKKLKTNDWKYRHSQPLDTEAVNSNCRLRCSQKECVTHHVNDCTCE